MSMPKIEKSENPIDREQSVSDLIESVALVETGLSHIINAEGEKIQKVLKYEEGSDVPIEDILRVNDSVGKMVNSVTKLEMMLQNKLDTTKELDTSSGGTPGRDGITPHIGANGNWWIGTTDTGVPAQGPQGPAGSSNTNYALSVINADLGTLVGSTTGVPIPLPTQNYINGFSANVNNTVFTVEEAGSYLVNYTLVASSGAGTKDTGLKINDVIDQDTMCYLSASGVGTNSIIRYFAVGDTIEFIILNQTLSLRDSLNASLTAIKIA